MKYKVDVGEAWHIYVPDNRYKVEKGEPFDVYSVTIVDAANAVTKSTIAIGATILSVPILGGAAMVGLVDGSYNELNTAYQAIAPLAGFIVGYYFTGSKS